MTTTSSFERARPWAAALLLAPTALLVTLGLAQSAGLIEVFGYQPHPALIFGGIGLACVLLLLALVRIQWDEAAAELVVRVSLRRWGVVAVLGLAVALCAVVLAYGFVENWLPALRAGG